MSILVALSKLKRNPHLAGVRGYTNLLYYDPNFVQLNLGVADIVEVDGCRFHVTNQINSLQRVRGNPWFEGVRPSDVVLDIGANIGAVTVPLAKVARKVYAVEPLYVHELLENIRLNNLGNVEVWKYAVGKFNPEKIVEFAGLQDTVKQIPFGTLRTLITDPIHFLKMDGEGCEWDIEPSELHGIRELRIEFHIRRGRVKECMRKFMEYLRWMETSGYKMHVEHPHYGLDPYDKEDYVVRASLR